MHVEAHQAVPNIFARSPSIFCSKILPHLRMKNETRFPEISGLRRAENMRFRKERCTVTRQSKNGLSNLLEDCELCAEWANKNDILHVTRAEFPLVPLSNMTMLERLYRAVGYLAQSGFEISGLWSLDGLLEPTNFQNILEAALSQSITEAYATAILLLKVAADWAEVDASHYEALVNIVGKLPSLSHSRRQVMPCRSSSYHASKTKSRSALFRATSA